MAKRQSIYVINSPEIQGEGSWVKVKRVEYGEAKKVRKFLRALDREIERVKDGTSQNGKSEEDLRDEQVAYNDQFISSKILAWNWVDDDDVPLPVPSQEPSVLDALDVQEMDWLSDVLSGEHDRKNK